MIGLTSSNLKVWWLKEGGFFQYTVCRFTWIPVQDLIPTLHCSWTPLRLSGSGSLDNRPPISWDGEVGVGLRGGGELKHSLLESVNQFFPFQPLASKGPGVPSSRAAWGSGMSSVLVLIGPSFCRH